MSGKFSIPSTKEAKALLEDVASSSQKKKRKKPTLLDTRVVDKHATEAASASFVTQAGSPPYFASASIEPSLTKSAKKARSKLYESKGMLIVTLPADGSVYSDISFVKDVAELLLLLANCKRLNDIRLVQLAEWSLTHLYQVRSFFLYFGICLSVSF